MTSHWQNYQEIKNKRTEKTPFFPREASQEMGISECELILSHPQAVYLGNDVKPVVMQLKNLSMVESIVRNDLAVHEKLGVYDNVKMGEKMGIALNVRGLDLRLFSQQWCHALALTEEKTDKTSRSIQFYDANGMAIDKVFMREENEQTLNAWQAILDEFATQSLPSFDKADESVDKKTDWQYQPLADAQQTADFHERWLALKDVHHFHGLINEFGLDKLSAYQQAPNQLAFKTTQNAFEQVFEAVKKDGFELMIFVGNTGMIQIQTGKIHHVKRMRGWLNILDKSEENFCLHLKDTDLAQIWVAQRPTKDGLVSCLEGFDGSGKSVITVFGFRREGNPEIAQWQQLVTSLPVADK